MTGADAQHTGVVMPPPLIYLVAFALVLVLDWSWPVAILGRPAAAWIGIAVLILGVAINGWGVYTMYRARTAIHPGHPANRLVTSGPFRYSRNPLYVGLNLVFLGLVLVVDSLWGLPVFLATVLVMHYGVIRREERHLEAAFGDEFRAYRARVRRYL